MGIHGSATCQMNLDGAVGTLVGQPNKGLNAMFVMMNAARLGVGNQSLGLTEVAYQNAVAYAKDRIQMRALSGPEGPDKPADPIIVHPDVRKMLLTARAYAEGGRALAIYSRCCSTRTAASDDEDERKEARRPGGAADADRQGLPDRQRLDRHSACMQVFGGHGYIKEWGMEQFVRDARINMIYEGTNTIQALDLLGRKVLGDNGAKLKKFGKLVPTSSRKRARRGMQEFVNPLADLGDKVTKLTMELGMKAMGNADEVGAAATDYLRVCGHLVFAYFWARMAKIALAKKDSRRPVLHRQAAHGALLLRQAAARDGRPDPQRALRHGAADGHGRSAVLNPPPPPQSKETSHEEPVRRNAAVRRRLGLGPDHPCRAVEDHRRQDQCREVAGAHHRQRRRCAQRQDREDPHRQADAKCTECTDERKGQPVQGMTILRGIKPDASEKGTWDGGDILDPNDGKIYKVLLKLADGGKKLDVRGYIGMPMLGRTQTWLRVE
jgi:uncharacterized protein (DUF2147 family)